eukprot:Tamp_19295.p1 GENE.Tamp_19295~~Tamp_19295.p1  ORF type:complete len:119 (+),score=16.35 Tamp_19295:211-567(+)
MVHKPQWFLSVQAGFACTSSLVCAHKAWSFDHVPQERKKSAKEQAHGHAYARAHELASMRAHAHVRKKTLQGHLKVLRSSLWLRMENFTKSFFCNSEAGDHGFFLALLFFAASTSFSP